MRRIVLDRSRTDARSGVGSERDGLIYPAFDAAAAVVGPGAASVDVPDRMVGAAPWGAAGTIDSRGMLLLLAKRVSLR